MVPSDEKGDRLELVVVGNEKSGHTSIEKEKQKDIHEMQSSRASSHAAASTSSPFSCGGRALCSRSSWRRGARKSEPPRATPKREKAQGSDGDNRGVFTSTSTSHLSFSSSPLNRASALSVAAAAAACSLLLSFPSPSFAENVRVEDVESPALRAGLEAANEQRWADAERLFRAFLVEEPDSASALSNLSQVELSTGRPQRALEHLDRAVALAPRAAVPRLNRALAKEALAVAAASKNSSSYERLLASAAEDAREASLLDPREFAAFFDLGNILERQGEFPAALEAFARAADLAPGLPGYRLREAASMFQVAVDNEEGRGGEGAGTRGGATAKTAAAATATTATKPAASSSAPSASVAKARKLAAAVARKNPTYAEARAALAAMAWQTGDAAAAEDALNSAVGLEGDWRKPGHAAVVTRWPPRLVKAYERLLAIE